MREVNVYSVASNTRMLEGNVIDFPIFEYNMFSADYNDHIFRVEDSDNFLYSSEPRPLDYYEVVHEKVEHIYYQGKDDYIVLHPDLKEILESPIKSVYEERMESLTKLMKFKETSLDSQKRLAESLDDRLTNFNNLSVWQKIKIALFNKSI